MTMEEQTIHHAEHTSYSIQQGSKYIPLGTDRQKAVDAALKLQENPVLITTTTIYKVTETPLKP